MSQFQLFRALKTGFIVAMIATIFGACTTPAQAQTPVIVDDSKLYIEKLTFLHLWPSIAGDKFTITGQINPAGVTNDLAGAKLTVQIANIAITNFVTLGGPVTLNASGEGTFATNGISIKASFDPASGKYSFSATGVDVISPTAIPNVTGLGIVTNFAVSVEVDGAGLLTSTAVSEMEVPYATLKDRSTRGLYMVRTIPPTLGVFQPLKTTAAQQGTNFVLNISGIFSIPFIAPEFATNGYVNVPFEIVTNGTVTIAINNEVINVPPRTLKTLSPTNQVIMLPSAGVPELSSLTLSPVTRTFRLVTKAIPDTGIPLATNGAPTSYQLPLTIAIPSGLLITNIGYDFLSQIATNITEDTNYFSTVIELKRPTSTSTKWSR